MNLELAQQLAVNGVVDGCLFALVGVSWNLIFGTTRVFHFAHVLALVAGAYGAVVTVGDYGWPIGLGIAAGVVAASAVGLGCEVGVYGPLRRAGTNELSMFLASMGVFIAGVNLVQIVFGPENRNLTGLPTAVRRIGSVVVTDLDLLLVGVTVVLVAAVALVERRSEIGLALVAARTNRDLAAAVGISVPRIYAGAFLAGSALVAFAGIYLSAAGAASPTMGVDVVVTGLIAMFLAGAGTTAGVAAAGMFLGLSQSLGGLWLPGHWQPIVVFVVLVVLLIVRSHRGLRARTA